MLYDVVMFIFVFFYFFRALFHILLFSFFFFNDTATPQIYPYCHTLSLHDALPICLHRGRELCGEGGNFRQLRFPYHAFTWSLDGKSRWIPAAWDFEDIDRETFSLPEVAVDTWNGFIFINFDREAKPLRDYLGKMVDQWSEWDFTKTRSRAITAVKTCPANWKAVMHAFIDTLHVTGPHPEAAPLPPAPSISRA